MSVSSEVPTVENPAASNNNIREILSGAMGDALVAALGKILENPDSQRAPQLLPFIDAASPSHYKLPLVRACLEADIPVWLHGEAGSGKSTMGEQIARQLDLPFRSISLGPTTSEAKLLGYTDANGHYHTTGLREIYEMTRENGEDGAGGIFLFDEIDNANPSVLTVLNALIANGHGEFPDGRVTRHDSARFIAAANTIGRGATAQYVGRAPIDAATIDRFAFIQTDTDDDLESYLATGEMPTRGLFDLQAGGVPTVRDWLGRVRDFRAAADEMKIRAIISPRATLYGRKLIESCNIGVQHLDDILIYKGMKEEDRSRLSEKVGTPAYAGQGGDVVTGEVITDTGNLEQNIDAQAKALLRFLREREKQKKIQCLKDDEEYEFDTNDMPNSVDDLTNFIQDGDE